MIEVAAVQNNAVQVTRQIKELLYLRHPIPEWASFEELRSTTGNPYKVTVRYLDFFALNLYPSRSHLRVVYEIKISRSDFMSELADPQKRTFAWDIANRCYFVCPAGLVSKSEIPKGWGLVELAEGRLFHKRAAGRHAAIDMPAGFIAAMARRAVREDSWRTTISQLRRQITGAQKGADEWKQLYLKAVREK